MGGSKTLIPLSEMGNVILNRNRPTWEGGNTDTRATPLAFYEPTLNREISSHEMGGGEV